MQEVGGMAWQSSGGGLQLQHRRASHLVMLGIVGGVFAAALQPCSRQGGWQRGGHGSGSSGGVQQLQ